MVDDRRARRAWWTEDAPTEPSPAPMSFVVFDDTDNPPPLLLDQFGNPIPRRKRPIGFGRGQ